jgi:hypothetical protein
MNPASNNKHFKRTHLVRALLRLTSSSASCRVPEAHLRPEVNSLTATSHCGSCGSCGGSWHSSSSCSSHEERWCCDSWGPRRSLHMEALSLCERRGRSVVVDSCVQGSAAVSAGAAAAHLLPLICCLSLAGVPDRQLLQLVAHLSTHPQHGGNSAAAVWSWSAGGADCNTERETQHCCLLPLERDATPPVGWCCQALHRCCRLLDAPRCRHLTHWHQGRLLRRLQGRLPPDPCLN